MESDSANATPPFPSPPTKVAKPKNRIRLIAVIAVAAIVVVVGALLVSSLLSAPQGPTWLFKGAYAKYEGSASVSFVTFSFTMRQEVVDFNSTHVELLMSASLGSSLSASVENETTTWVPLASNVYTVESGTPVNSYEAENMYFAGIGNRDCIVYEYATDGPTMTIYVDKAIGWPLQMKLSMTGEGSVSLELEINLVETNIPGLK
ncbi:hypothetical protein MUO79_06250 [Candidatus Bathyarchaeota archaeon]|nr:hypothetical protein [Candidatus Bathyarchaeota archaeon]